MIHSITMSDISKTLNNSIQKKLDLLKVEFKLNDLKIGPLNTPLTIDFYEKWLAQNLHGSMTYLKDHLELKRSPQQLSKSLKSVISVSQSYFPAVQKSSLKIPARVALYSQNEDYHFWLKEKLQLIADRLKSEHPEHEFLAYVDSGPVLERDLAYQNGLGWFGKNTCLIHPKHGSLFFIAEILTSLESESSHEPLPDFCGKCNKCQEICPTEALLSPRTLDATKCISFLTIESKTTPPQELRSKMGDWFFGCDLCQTVCPWNEKYFKLNNLLGQTETSTSLNSLMSEGEREELIKYFRFLLTASHKQIQKHHYGSPLLRAGAKGLKRNALIVIGNQKLIELKNEVSQLNTPDLEELSEWTLAQLN
jgi:epoxyqueuosine reductase